LSRKAIEAAETLCHRRIHLVRRPSRQGDQHPQVLQVVNTFGEPGVSLPSNHCEPFILPVEPGLIGADAETIARFLTSQVTPASRVLGRLTRKVLGATVGIALGGGGAFGIAHVGVLSALTEAGVPIDLVAGTSMGSIVAIGYAAGLEPSSMLSIAGRIGNVRTALSAIDPSLSGTGLLTGRRLVSIFSPLIPKHSFEELELPCRVVAMDVETGERVDIGSGRLDDAFRASCSIPVLFKPVQVGGRTLVDGGMIDPVPTDVVREMGADVVIAVNVVPQLQRGVSTAISRTFKRVNRLNPLSYFSGTRDAPDIVDVFMNSLQTTEYELGHFKSLAADVLISVDMAEFTWIDFHRAQEIIERGREAGARFSPAARAAMQERLAPLLSS
jgi:NTE family protein